MSNRVDYPGRTSCGCPYLNQPDPERHWKDCHYRLNAQQAEPAPAQDEQCDTCHGRGEIWTGETAYQGHFQPPEPVMDTCPECSGESVIRPAQTEQQPVAEVLWPDEPGRRGGFSQIGHYDDPRLPVGAKLYAAPIAQTDPQPEQSGRNEYMPLELIGILQRYKRDLELRTFLDNDEGDYQLRWTAKEIARVSAALSAQGESHE